MRWRRDSKFSLHAQTLYFSIEVECMPSYIPSINSNNLRSSVPSDMHHSERRLPLAHTSNFTSPLPSFVFLSKSFSSSNIYRDHVASRKHKETILKASKLSSNAGASTSKRTVEEDAIPLVFHIPGQKPTTATEALENLDSLKDSLPNSAAEASSIPEPIKTSEIQAQASSSSTNQEENENTRNAAKANLLVPANATEEDIKHAIDAKIASSVRINPNTTCLFCAIKVDDLESNIEHMRKSHGFFLPEQDYLIDLNGLMGYLADKISVGNICLYCNGRGRAFNELNAVRKHMLDKSHCKIAYDDEEDRLELSDFYNFESSYPVDSDEEWEDEDDEDAEVDEEGEIINQTKKRSSNKGNGIRYGDSEFELILPSGNRLGHRSLRRYYQQTLWQTPATHLSQQERARNGDWNVNVAEGTGTLARRIAAGRPGAGRGGLDEEVGGDDADANNGGLVVRDRNGMQVRARNRGEAKEAVRHTREFRDRDRKEQFKTKAMYRNNNQVSTERSRFSVDSFFLGCVAELVLSLYLLLQKQKHFRDHLLQ